MSILTIVGLIVLLFVQNSVFTLVSRSRNSGNTLYHFPIAILSNGIWFVVNYIFIFPEMLKQVEHSDSLGMFYLALLYTIPTSLGSVFMMWLSIKKLEKGDRKSVV